MANDLTVDLLLRTNELEQALLKTEAEVQGLRAELARMQGQLQTSAKSLLQCASDRTRFIAEINRLAVTLAALQGFNRAVDVLTPWPAARIRELLEPAGPPRPEPAVLEVTPEVIQASMAADLAGIVPEVKLPAEHVWDSGACLNCGARDIRLDARDCPACNQMTDSGGTPMWCLAHTKLFVLSAKCPGGGVGVDL